MLYRLSVAWGVPASTLAEMLTADDLADYLAYYALEPWGCRADDVRSAIVAYTSHASAGGKGRFPDFLPTWTPPDRVPYGVWAEQFTAYARAHNGRRGT